MADDVAEALLVVCAHPDDECLGAGGTILNHTGRGIPVDVMCLTGNTRRNRELKQACSTLGVRRVFTNERSDFDVDMSLVEEVADTILQSRPRAIVTHMPDDYNRAHVITSKVVMEAVEWASHTTIYPEAHRVERVFFMETNSLMTHPQVFVDITESYATAVQALRQHESQMSKAHEFYPRLYDARTRLRGVQSECERAEAFRVVWPQHAGPFYPQNHISLLL